ncbi:MAG: lipid II flippase MurJ [Acidimicrobiales bacterium]
MTTLTTDRPTGGQDDAAQGSSPGSDIGRATVAVSVLNLVSRLTGLARVVAMSAALGATTLGDTYQAANLVSNIMFEVLAAGVLSAALVPAFVKLIDRGRRDDAARLAGVVLGAALAVLAVVVALALVGAPWIMGLLTVGVDDAGTRVAQTELGTFLLWFFLPQVLLYAVGAVATALLHADRRFVAAAVAPVFNNVMVIAAMLTFWAMRSGPPSLDLTTAERLVLAGGATAGVVAMTLVPLLAVWRGGLALRPRWAPRDPRLGPLAVLGLWATGHLAAMQLFALASLVVANEVAGGVVAYQVAYTFFLFPYALLAQPLTTTLYPRLAATATAGRLDDLTSDLAWGLRTLTFVLVPASVVVAALARPVIETVRLGNLDGAGADLVALAVASYMAGLLGFAAFFLLTRASYALGDTRTPTLVNLSATAVGILSLVVVATLVEGSAVLVALGLVHAGVVTVAALVLYSRLRRRLGPVTILPTVLRTVLLGAASGAAAWAVVAVVGHDTRPVAALAVALAAVVAAGVHLVGSRLIGAPELGDMGRVIGRTR